MCCPTAVIIHRKSLNFLPIFRLGLVSLLIDEGAELVGGFLVEEGGERGGMALGVVLIHSLRRMVNLLLNLTTVHVSGLTLLFCDFFRIWIRFEGARGACGGLFDGLLNQFLLIVCFNLRCEIRLAGVTFLVGAGGS